MLNVPADGSATPQRLEFAHTLRGLAALSVLISHFLGVFWLAPGAVAVLLNIESLAVSPPAFIAPLHFTPHLNYGSLGVGVFFLISGFVIPFSLSALSRPAFLIARIFRIYPVYIVAFSISVMVLLLLSKYGGAKPFPYSIEHLIAQGLLLRGWLWIPSVDGLSWTLEIEIVFYAIAALLSSFILHPQIGGRVVIGYVLVVPLLCILGVNSIDLLGGRLQTMMLYLTYALPFTVYMFIGTLFYLSAKGTVTPAQLVMGVLAALFGFSIGLAAHPALKTLATSSYLLALGIFALFYLARDSFKSNRVLDWLADISYPLYAVHSIVGYALIYTLVSRKIPAIMAIVTAFAVVILLAWGIHLTIEVATTRFGKQLGRKLFPRAAT